MIRVSEIIIQKGLSHIIRSGKQKSYKQDRGNFAGRMVIITQGHEIRPRGFPIPFLKCGRFCLKNIENKVKVW